MTTIPDATIGRLATLIGPAIDEAAAEMVRAVREATTQDDAIRALAPGWTLMTIRRHMPEVVDRAARMRPDLFGMD